MQVVFIILLTTPKALFYKLLSHYEKLHRQECEKTTPTRFFPPEVYKGLPVGQQSILSCHRLQLWINVD